MDTVTRAQLLDEAVGISHSANISAVWNEKGMNPIILPQAMGK